MQEEEEVFKTERGVACVYYSGTYKRYVCDVIKPRVERKTFVRREQAREFAQNKTRIASEAAEPQRAVSPQRSSSRWDVLRGTRSSSSSSSSSSSKSLSNSA